MNDVEWRKTEVAKFAEGQNPNAMNRGKEHEFRQTPEASGG